MRGQGPIAQIARMGSVVRVTVASHPPLIAELPATQAASLDLNHGAIVAAAWPPEAVRLVVAEGAPQGPTDAG